MKPKYRIAYVNNSLLYGTYFKVQKKGFWGWRNVYYPDNLITSGIAHSDCRFDTYEEANKFMEKCIDLENKGVVQLFPDL